MKRARVVTIFGSSAPQPGESLYLQAYELGYAIAAAGWIVCNGGYAGTMRAGAHGARAAGGRCIGVTCRAFGSRKANEYISESIVTSNLFARLEQLCKLGRAYVILPGGTGTLVELALVSELTSKRFLRGRRPVVLLGDYWRPVLARAGAETPAISRLHVVTTVAEVMQVLSDAFNRPPKTRLRERPQKAKLDRQQFER